MHLEVIVTTDAIAVAAAVLARVTGVVLLAPVLATRSAPRPVRVAMVLALSAAMLATVDTPTAATWRHGVVLALVAELVLGVALGFAAELLLSAVELAASALSFAAGMSYVNVVDPTSPVQGTALMSVQRLLGAALFLAADGHHLVLRALAHSFAVVPPGAATFGKLGGAVVAAASTLFSFGMALAAPALLVLLLVDLALGLVGRVAPHAHALIIGMGLKPTAAFVALALVYHALPGAFADALERTAVDLGQIMLAGRG